MYTFQHRRAMRSLASQWEYLKFKLSPVIGKHGCAIIVDFHKQLINNVTIPGSSNHQSPQDRPLCPFKCPSSPQQHPKAVKFNSSFFHKPRYIDAVGLVVMVVHHKTIADLETLWNIQSEKPGFGFTWTAECLLNGNTCVKSRGHQRIRRPWIITYHHKLIMSS